MTLVFGSREYPAWTLTLCFSFWGCRAMLSIVDWSRWGPSPSCSQMPLKADLLSHVTFCQWEGMLSSFWLREDGSSAPGDMPAEPASWLKDSFLESERPVHNLSASVHLPRMHWFMLPWKLRQEHVLRRLGYRGHGNQTACQSAPICSCAAVHTEEQQFQPSEQCLV